MSQQNSDERLAFLEKDLGLVKFLQSKIDMSVDKLTAISADVTQLLAVHENRLGQVEKTQEQLIIKVDKNKEISDSREDRLHDKYEDIRDELKRNFKEEISAAKEEILMKLSESNKKISALEKWMWTCLGGAVVLFLLFDKALPLLIH